LCANMRALDAGRCADVSADVAGNAAASGLIQAAVMMTTTRLEARAARVCRR
jgi:hypothetical protein